MSDESLDTESYTKTEDSSDYYPENSYDSSYTSHDDHSESSSYEGEAGSDQNSSPEDGQSLAPVHKKISNLSNPHHESNESFRRKKRRNQINRLKNKVQKHYRENQGFQLNQEIQQLIQEQSPVPELEGMVQILDKNQAFLRFPKQSFYPRTGDPLISKEEVDKYKLRHGLTIKGKVIQRRNKDQRLLYEITEIEGKPPKDWSLIPYFQNLTSVNPYEFFHLSTPQDPDKSMTLLELFAPIGKGQRALLVAPPRTGKTVLMEKIINGITANHPNVEAIVLLIDERPEEVTHISRRVRAKVYASCLDKPIQEHVAVSRMVMEMAQRKAENGKDVVIFLDSITRMSRAFNNQLKSTGRTLSGGVDAQALIEPKKFFGSARKLEEGGSLTIIATALIQTGSQMDEVIFQEFKGTGNMELVLNRKTAEKRIYPAIDINLSGTRREELILPEDYYKASIKFRRYLSTLNETNQIQAAIQAVEKYKTTKDFVREFV